MTSVIAFARRAHFSRQAAQVRRPTGFGLGTACSARVLVPLALVAALSFAPSVHAAGVDPAVATPVQREQAQSIYARGKAKFDKGDYAGALQEFENSLEIIASPNTRLYAARSLEKMGRLVEAYAEYGRTAVEAKEHEHEDGRYAKAGEAATAERNLLTPRLGFLEIKVSNANDQTKLTVGGAEIRRAAWGEAIPVKPGETDVELETPGASPVKSKIIVAAGSRVPLPLDANAPAAGAATPVPPTQPAPESGSNMKWTFPAAIAAGGVAAAGLITFIVAGAISKSTYSDLQQACGNAPCPQSKASEVSAGKTQQTVANVGLVITAVGAVASGVFFALYFTHKDSTPAAPATGVYFGPTELGVRGSF